MKDVVIVTYPQGQTLDVTGPLEVFSTAARILQHLGKATTAYRPQVVALEAGPVRMSSGLELIATGEIGRLRRRVDTLLVAGGEGSRAAMKDKRMRRGLQRMAPLVRRLGSVCTGAFCLAEAGLLDGRSATTHWQRCAALARRYAAVHVQPDAIYVKDGPLWTSAGVTAGMDMALAMVEEDFGHDVALSVARQLVMFVKRPGGQSQFSATLRGQRADRSELRELSSWITEHLADELHVDALAQRCAMSPRNFARAFRKEVGESPARYVERARVEGAKQRLQTTTLSLEQTAQSCGFGATDTMRRAFHRQLGVSPRQYRDRFRASGASPRQGELL